MPFNKICPSCKKRRLWLSRKWIKPKHLPPIQPIKPLCFLCLKKIESIY